MPVAVEFSKDVHKAIMGSTPTKVDKELQGVIKNFCKENFGHNPQDITGKKVDNNRYELTINIGSTKSNEYKVIVDGEGKLVFRYDDYLRIDKGICEEFLKREDIPKELKSELERIINTYRIKGSSFLYGIDITRGLSERGLSQLNKEIKEKSLEKFLKEVGVEKIDGKFYKDKKEISEYEALNLLYEKDIKYKEKLEKGNSLSNIMKIFDKMEKIGWVIEFKNEKNWFKEIEYDVGKKMMEKYVNIGGQINLSVERSADGDIHIYVNGGDLSITVSERRLIKITFSEKVLKRISEE